MICSWELLHLMEVLTGYVQWSGTEFGGWIHQGKKISPSIMETCLALRMNIVCI